MRLFTQTSPGRWDCRCGSRGCENAEAFAVHVGGEAVGGFVVVVETDVGLGGVGVAGHGACRIAALGCMAGTT